MTPWRFSCIDESNCADHFHIEPSDQCLFVREFSASDRFEIGNTKSLIGNLKKEPCYKKTPQYKYKAQAIAECASYIARGLKPEWLKNATLVPVPPSKAKSDAEYDDRMLQVLQNIKLPYLDVRELVTQTKTTRASHMSAGHRLTIRELIEVYQIEEDCCEPVPTSIAVVDDVLTAGTHFKAMQFVLKKRFPNAQIVGLFIARWVHPKPLI